MTAPEHHNFRVRLVGIAMLLISLTITPGDAEAQSPSDTELCRAAPGAEATSILFTRWIREVWHQGRLDLVPALVGADYIRHEGSGTRTVTAAQYAEEVASVRRRLPDVRFVIHDCDAVGDRLWTRWSMVGTSNESGRVVHRMALQVYRIAGGRLAETWSVTLPTDAAWPEQGGERRAP